METFIWTPDEGATEEKEPRVRKVAFGDSYEQRAGDGLNIKMAKWSGMTFSGRDPFESQDIWAFLEARGGTEAFLWTPPGGVEAIFVCPRYSRRPMATTDQISADFYQVPA